MWVMSPKRSFNKGLQQNAEFVDIERRSVSGPAVRWRPGRDVEPSRVQEFGRARDHFARIGIEVPGQRNQQLQRERVHFNLAAGQKFEIGILIRRTWFYNRYFKGSHRRRREFSGHLRRIGCWCSVYAIDDERGCRRFLRFQLETQLFFQSVENRHAIAGHLRDSGTPRRNLKSKSHSPFTPDRSTIGLLI
jgi:hypothetical protein